MTVTTRASLDELEKKRANGEISPPRSDAAGIDLPEDFWKNAKIRKPAVKKQVNLRVDPDIIDFFKAGGDGHLTRMHDVLRSYVDAHRKR